MKSCYCLIVYWFSRNIDREVSVFFISTWKGNHLHFDLRFKGVLLNVTFVVLFGVWAAESEFSFMRLGWEILCHDMCFLSDSSMLAWLLKLEYIAIILCSWLRMVVMVMVVSTCLHIYLLYVSTWMISLWMWISEVIRGLKYY